MLEKEEEIFETSLYIKKVVFERYVSVSLPKFRQNNECIPDFILSHQLLVLLWNLCCVFFPKKDTSDHYHCQILLNRFLFIICFNFETTTFDSLRSSAKRNNSLLLSSLHLLTMSGQSSIIFRITLSE